MFSYLTSTWTAIAGAAAADDQAASSSHSDQDDDETSDQVISDPGGPDSEEDSGSDLDTHATEDSLEQYIENFDPNEAFDSSFSSSEPLDEDAILQKRVADGAAFQQIYPAAKQEFTGMPAMYLSPSLNQHREALRHDVLRARLTELALAVEFGTSFGPNGRNLTVMPLDAIRHHSRNAPTLPDDLPAAGALPPLTASLYMRLVRSMPIFAGRGEEYLYALDDFVENDFLDFNAKWMRATKFDILGFMVHYVTLFSHLLNEAWYGCDGVRQSIPDFATPVEVLPTTFYPDLLAYYRSALPGGGTFRLGRHHRRSGVVADDATTYLREQKAKDFTNAWRQFSRAACDILRSTAYDENKDFVGRFWEVVRTAPKLQDLPQLYQDFFCGLARAIAFTVDNVLDENEWRRKVTAIWNRLPITVLLTSLRLINPIPFMDRMVKLFCWRPPGMLSLLQRIGATMCASERTAKHVRTLSKGVSSNVSSIIEASVDMMFSSKKILLPISSQDSPELIRAFLKKPLRGAHVTDQEVAYAKAYIRKREKEEFVEALGSKSVIDIVKHVAEVAPPLLDEYWKCFDFAGLMSKLVTTVGRVLEALNAYDGVRDPAEALETHNEVTEAIYEALIPFVEHAYQLLHALSKRKPAGDFGFHAIVKHLFDDLLSPEGSQTAILELGTLVKTVIDSIPADERATLWEEVDRIVAYMEAGVDAREWEPCEVLEEKALPVFWKRLVESFCGLEISVQVEEDSSVQDLSDVD
ncbi:hypothetical protein BC832DRAFT_563226 [Gaertneriomyces semiglobifer]|nr:hypothetical protein BC832DRAFT_563226 [Gaertneriomyces semiglobifer]